MFNPYSRFRGKDLSLNDYLAIDRTVLANERTLLSYGRTGLALVVLGGSLIQFLDPLLMRLLGGVFIAAGLAMMWRGWQRYFAMKHLLRSALREMTGKGDHPLKEGDKEQEKKPDAAPPREADDADS